MKLDFMEPIFQRIGLMHGCAANPGCMQVPVAPDKNGRPQAAQGVVDYLADFRTIWTRATRGFLSQARAGDVLFFAPELLSGTNYYARLFQSSERSQTEESDRYAEALLLACMIRELFEDQHREKLGLQAPENSEGTP